MSKSMEFDPLATVPVAEAPPRSEKTISAASYDSEERIPIYRDTTGRPAVFEPVPAFEPMALMEFSPNQEWEYRVVPHHVADASQLEETFNRLGAKKWELVGFDPHQGRSVFKRVVEKQS